MNAAFFITMKEFSKNIVSHISFPKNVINASPTELSSVNLLFGLHSATFLLRLCRLRQLQSVMEKIASDPILTPGKRYFSVAASDEITDTNPTLFFTSSSETDEPERCKSRSEEVFKSKRQKLRRVTRPEPSRRDTVFPDEDVSDHDCVLEIESALSTPPQLSSGFFTHCSGRKSRFYSRSSSRAAHISTAPATNTEDVRKVSVLLDNDSGNISGASKNSTTRLPIFSQDGPLFKERSVVPHRADIQAILERRRSELEKRGIFENRKDDISKKSSTFRRNNVLVYDSNEESDDADEDNVYVHLSSEEKYLHYLKLNWAKTLRETDGKLLQSTAANQMDTDGEPLQPGEVAYVSVGLSEKNNADLQHIYNTIYKPKAMRGQPIHGFVNLRSAAGQYARLCISLELVRAEDLYKPGELFSLIILEHPIQLYVYFFQARARATTINGKLHHLKVLAEFAENYFSDQLDKKTLAHVAVKRLLGYQRAEKVQIRRGLGRSLDQRVAEGKYMVHADFVHFRKIAAEELGRIFTGIEAETESEAIQVICNSPDWKSIVDKWCINFLMYLMFSAHGQRTQVYAHLLVPSHTQIEAWNTHQISLAVQWDKIPRSLECPGVILPGKAKNFMLFDIYVVRESLLRKLGQRDQTGEAPTLLLNTRHGGPLKTSEIGSTLRSFLTRHDPELRTVTPTTLRYSYASIMFDKFKSGKVGSSQTAEEYLENLGKLMNTSVEMLRQHYIATDRTTFSRVVRTMAQAFEDLESED
jgi:hypothetical protein